MIVDSQVVTVMEAKLVFTTSPETAGRLRARSFPREGSAPLIDYSFSE